MGRAGAKIFAVLLFSVSLTTLTVSLTSFSRFVQQTALPQTPPYILPILITVISALSLKNGLRSLSGSARFLAPFSVAVVILFIIPGLLGIFPGVFSFPIENAGKILSSAGEIFLNRFLGIVPLISVYTRMKNTRKRKKYFLSSVLVSGAVMTVVSAIVVGNLGTHIAERDFYPTFTVMSSHGMGGFIRHTEIFASVMMTFCLFFKSAVGLLFFCDMTEGIFSLEKKRETAVPFALITASLTQVIYSDISKLRELLSWKNTAVFAVAGVIFLSLLLYILSYFSKRKYNPHRNTPVA